MNLTDFDYELPEALIAQYPPVVRGDSRLLCLDGNSGELRDAHFSEFIALLRPDDLLVFNNTRVIPARLYGHKQSGGKLEILLERLLSEKRALAHVRASKSPKAGSSIVLDNEDKLTVVGREGALYVLESEKDLAAIMQQAGHMPLPPYINRADAVADQDRYQTVYASQSGAVAAPTAGLHFTDALLQQIRDKGITSVFVTLHVGAGTFQPVRSDNLDEHEMHAEYVDVDQTVVDAVQAAKRRGGRVIAVGTTSVRSLESAAQSGEIREFHGDTQLFIRPGYPFRVVDALLTNFHLPQSTLLMLVSALGGLESIRQAYRHAIEKHYRFFSYGDAMWITRQELTS
ncbi:MAG: tRNA preQ1(34) S-adenosylmethionine ribosyltransferase-isomerase QueA [Chromatiales bacterium]|jgi:S-adenosylmethionine:tRNA ribosyltransferase-isomerase